jgi:autotransporter-associated beta strand protein
VASGSQKLADTNSFTGTTTVSQGTLEAAATGALGATTGITINSGGTLLLSNAGTTDRINDSATVTLGG